MTPNTGQILAAATDEAKRDLGFFLQFVKTFDEVEPDPLKRIKAFPADQAHIQWLAREFQREKLLWVPKSRRMIMTWFQCAAMVWSALTPGFHGFIQSKKEEDADFLVKDRCWFIWQHLPLWMKKIAMKGFTEAHYKWLKLEFPNRSKIWGVPQGPDQFRQYTPSRILVDEAAYHDYFGETLAAILPLREKDCAIHIVSSAKGGTTFAKVVNSDNRTEPKDEIRGIQTWWLDRGGKVVRIHYTADPDKDPERNGLEWYTSLREQYPDEATWRQEMEIDFSAYSGQLVYPQYTDSYPQVIEPIQIPVDAPRWRVIDYGRRNPTCCLWFAEIDNEYYVYREFYQAELPVSEIKRQITDMSEGEDYIATWVDPSTDEIREANTPSIYYHLNRPPYSLRAQKGTREAFGRHVVAQWLSDERLHLFKTCTKTRKEFIDYRYEEWSGAVAESHNLKEQPKKKDDHAMDCLKMFANGVQYREAQKEREQEEAVGISPRGMNIIARLRNRGRYMGQHGVLTHA